MKRPITIWLEDSDVQKIWEIAQEDERPPHAFLRLIVTSFLKERIEDDERKNDCADGHDALLKA